MSGVPELRISAVNQAPVRDGGDWVLYWMIASRRARWNFGLERAVERARELGKPLLVLEALRCGYEWASDRLHRFVIDGMEDNRRAFADTGALYYPYVEPEEGAGKGLLEALAARAAVVVTDEFPCFFLPRMVAAAGERLEVRLEAVDSNGLLPLRAADREFFRAFDFRRFLQQNLRPHLEAPAKPNPLARQRLPRLERLPAAIARRWPPASKALLAGEAGLEELPIDHAVPPSEIRGGTRAAEKRLAAFLDERLPRYAEGRNHPDDETTSGLSPYLHFGHLSTWQVLAELAEREDWSPDKVSDETAGKRRGWWNMSEAAEAFLDELVTWREVGYNFTFRRKDYDRYDSLPEWARATLEEHAGDERPDLYTRRQFERAATHDELWNAAQNQLRRQGRIHSYLRMLWGKKILHWSRGPRQALEIMTELNNKYALDGRNPNSYSGIFWVLGRYDRPWGPERPVFGKIRYMTSASTRRKLRLDAYIARWNVAEPDSDPS